MEPISLLTIAVLKWLAVAAVIAVSYLAISSVRDYLRNKKAQKTIREDAALFKTRLKSGKVRVVAGFLDGKDGLKETQAWEADEVDSFIKGMKDDEVVIVR